jgi:hypothetical protein
MTVFWGDGSTWDSTVQCTTCGQKDHVEFAHCLRKGWPKHCDQTMRLVATEADVTTAVQRVVWEPVRIALRQMGEVMEVMRP